MLQAILAKETYLREILCFCLARLYPGITPYRHATTPHECSSCFDDGKDECHDKRADS